MATVATAPEIRLPVRVDADEAIARVEALREAAVAVRRELAPTPGFQTSEGKLTALRQAAYAILGVLGLFGVHAGSATGQIDKWLPIAAFAAALIDGAVYTAHRSGVKAAFAQAIAAVIPAPEIHVEAPVEPDAPEAPPEAPPAETRRRNTPAQDAAQARRAAREAAEKRAARKTAARKRPAAKR